jgi:hypothetical protein
MPIRHLNYTGRKRILRADAKVLVTSDPDGRSHFSAILSLGDYDLPGDAQVYIEAYRQTTLMRFEYGTVAAGPPISSAPRYLSEFSSKAGLLFRVKITSTGDRPGVLLAEADRVAVTDSEDVPDNRLPLLPIAPTDLAQDIWRIDISGDNGPLLQVNQRFGDWKTLAVSPVFRSLVYPAAMRQVLFHIRAVDEVVHLDDLSDWRCQWLTFAAALPGVGEPPSGLGDIEDWVNWIDTAVMAFTRSHDFLNRLVGAFSEVTA